MQKRPVRRGNGILDVIQGGSGLTERDGTVTPSSCRRGSARPAGDGLSYPSRRDVSSALRKTSSVTSMVRRICTRVASQALFVSRSRAAS